MKLSKKARKIILISLSAVIILAILCQGIYQIVWQTTIRSRYVRYEDCALELNMLAGFLQDKYPDEETRPEYLRVAGEKMLLDPESGYINLPDEVSRSITSIAEKGFVSDKTEWYVIMFIEDRIQFEVTSGAYALVFSPEGEPTYLHSPTEDFHILVEHIEGSWYHITRTR